MAEEAQRAFAPSASEDSPASSAGAANGRARPGGVRVSDDLLLDAARTCVLAAGLRRTTLAEIARTAGVSRMTLYRRFPDVGSILSALMTREFGAVLREADAAGESARTARERLTRSAVAAVRLLNANPLLRAVVDKDAEVLAPYVVVRLGRTQRFGEQVISALLRAGREDGSIRAGDLAAQARALLLVIQSFVLSLRAATSGIEAESLLDELAQQLDGALRP
ncbi:TetR/AcrR family transcriptional regulator [Amycolatopsis taiwanensis]|uniref:TetR family transcriptional regulator n=1 Tax=Amycolatopsis taiwanensis TaxID=342230 RepID=A0A9W6R863_9PSEU|nr:TetR/AcrR family transcriptional regulator [Amycolatopsis taiwanensis]GLY69220.1 TetR family transcriptional regulator [Amycolatopsis taiwanensis]